MSRPRISVYKPHQYVFVLNGTNIFQTYSGLKSHLGRIPKGSKPTWDPGCMRDGREPLLNSEKEMKEFSVYCDSLGIEFRLGSVKK